MCIFKKRNKHKISWEQRYKRLRKEYFKTLSELNEEVNMANQCSDYLKEQLEDARNIIADLTRENEELKASRPSRKRVKLYAKK